MWPCLPMRSSRMTFIVLVLCCPGSGPVRSRGPSATPAGQIWVLRDRVRHDADEAGALDRLGEGALLEGRHRGDAGRHDLAALGNVTLQQADVLVVDLGRVRA